MTELAAKLKKMSFKIPFRNRTAHLNPKASHPNTIIKWNLSTYQKRIDHLERNHYNIET